MMRLAFLSVISLCLAMSGCGQAEPTIASRDVSAEEASELLKANPEIVILDVRTPDEFTKGHIEGAELINFMGDDFDTKITALDKDKVYLMHCASGGRSGQALKKFSDHGFVSILHLKSGFMGWETAGLPVSK